MGAEPHRRRSRASAVAGCAALVLCVVMLAVVFRPGAAAPRYLEVVESRATATAEPDSETVARIEAFCSDCHALPRPGSFPRDRWHFEAKKGYEFYARSGRTDLDVPPLQQTLAYYRARAAALPKYPEPEPAEHASGTRFEIERRRLNDPAATLPEISDLAWGALERGAAPVMLACDMRYGQIVALDPLNEAAPPQILARLDHPAHVEFCDLTGRGARDLLVADLGTYLPADHSRGRVVLLTRREDGSYAPRVLAAELGRVADARAADFDGDGRLDVVVAEFGWQETGSITLLRNVTAPGEALRFERARVDLRPGTIHVPVHDFDGDGRADFAALVSQEYESVELFLNGGSARPDFAPAQPPPFHRYPLWSGPDLSFGASGMSLADLDGDGDIDLLVTNGDAWDNHHASPQHGVQWIENRGSQGFAYHRLASMPGASHAQAGDIDGDGDADIIAVAWLPPDVEPPGLRSQRRASIVCLEQTEPGRFAPHRLETGAPHYATVELGDFDDDGDLDFAVGSGPQVAAGRTDGNYFSIWWNQSIVAPGR